MVRTKLIGIVLALAFAASAHWMPSAAAGGKCPGCAKVAEKGEGSCCGTSYAFGMKIESKKLYAALAGMKVDAEKVGCPGCKNAIAHDGDCEHCGVHAANGKVYRSPVAAVLAKGTPMSGEVVEACPKRCDACKVAFEKNEMCSGCGVGFVAGRMYKGEKDYKAALVAHKTLEHAVKAASHCEDCAVGLVMNGSCDKCNVKFEDGKVAKG